MLKQRSVMYWTVFSILVACSVLLLFWLPYHVPVQRSLSDSYLFGFNNRVCWLLFIALLVLLAQFGPRIRGAPGDERPLGRRSLRVALGGNLLCSAAMFLLTRKLVGYDESIYLTDRLRLVLEGRIPYRDFEFAYGVGMLYLPACLARLLHLGAADAYGLFYLLVSLTGVYLLYLCVQWIGGSSTSKRSIFWFLWIISLLSTLNFGVNYSLLRYDLPVFLILLLQRRIQQTVPGLVPFGLACLGYMVVLLDSPELAVAFAAGASVYLALAGRLQHRRNLAAYLAMLAVLLGFSGLAAHFGAFNTLIAFRTGGFNFPVIPSAAIDLFLIAAGIAACWAGTQLQLRGKGPTLPLFCLGLFTSASALGRCDPGHVLLNGLPFFLAAGVVSPGLRRPWRWLVPALWLTFAVIPIALGLPALLNALGKAALPTVFAMEPPGSLSRFDGWVLRRMQRQLGEPFASEKFAEYEAAAHRPKQLDVDRLFAQTAGTVFEAPFGFSVTHFGLFHARAVDEGYYFEMINVITPEQVNDKLNELKTHPDRPLLLLPGREDTCAVSPDAERALISSIFLFPYRHSAVHPESLSEPLCAYIHTHYRRTLAASPAHFGYALWVPNLE